MGKGEEKGNRRWEEMGGPPNVVGVGALGVVVMTILVRLEAYGTVHDVLCRVKRVSS